MKKLLLALFAVTLISGFTFAKQRPSSPNKRPSSPSVSASLSDELCSDCTALFIYLSFYNNIYANFDDYPYATRSKYITLDAKSSEPQWYRVTLDANGFYSPEFNNYGADVRLEAYLWKFFGPVFENRLILSAQNSAFRQGYMHLGAQFSICQFYPFSFIFDIKWQHLYGFYTANGLNLGIGFRSYPIKPLILEYRAEWGNFSNSDNHTDEYTGIRRNATFHSHLEAGFMTSTPVEVYGFWDYTMDGFLERKEHSFGAGAKYHF